MKKNYYRLVDADFYCVATYYGTKSNANAYFCRYLSSSVPVKYSHDLYRVLTYSSYESFLQSSDSAYVSYLRRDI
uniref:KTSC domain-containing protein n=1 Tax=Dulem virus 252 TaxID=3145729 RepID=A0AAU8AX86_9VIRU